MLSSIIKFTKKNKTASIIGVIVVVAAASKAIHKNYFSDEAKEESRIKNDLVDAAKKEAAKKIEHLRKEREAKAEKEKEKAKAAEANENQTKGKESKNA